MNSSARHHVLRFRGVHEFYTEVVGFEMGKVVKRQAMGGPQAGWTKHPDGNMVEHTMDKGPFSQQGIDEAKTLLADDMAAELPNYLGMLYFPHGRIIHAPSSE